MSLGDLGFTAEQEGVYRLLLSLGPSDLKTLAEQSHLDDERLHAALDGLTDRGVIHLDATGVHVPDPRVVLGSAIEELEEQLWSRYRRVSATRTEIGELHSLYAASSRTSQDHADFERLDGVEAVRARIAELSFFARSSVLAIHPGGPQSPAALEASRPLDRRAIRRGMHIRVIHDRSVLDDALNRAYLDELVLLGVQVRVADDLVERLIVLDDQVAVVPIDPSDSHRGAVVVRHAGVIVGLLGLFNRVWETADASPWTPSGAGEDLVVTDQDKRLLALLAAGCTDEVAAREFGVSVRHLRRRIARLMSDLGARSRFEAGVQASRRGWL